MLKIPPSAGTGHPKISSDIHDATLPRLRRIHVSPVSASIKNIPLPVCWSCRNPEVFVDNGLVNDRQVPCASEPLRSPWNLKTSPVEVSNRKILSSIWTICTREKIAWSMLMTGLWLLWARAWLKCEAGPSARTAAIKPIAAVARTMDLERVICEPPVGGREDVRVSELQ